MKHPMTLREALIMGHVLFQQHAKALSAQETAALIRLLDHAQCSVSIGGRIPRRKTARTFTLTPKETVECNGE